MRFTVSSTGLLSRLQTLSRVIISKNPLPILENILFRIDGNELELTASDLTLTLITRMGISDADVDGTIALPAKILLETLQVLPEQPLTFDIDVESLSVKIQSTYGEYKIIGQPGGEFPSLAPMEEGAKVLTLNAESALRGITNTLFATSNDDLRPVMTGIYFDIHGNDLTMVATDAHKLVRFELKDCTQSDGDSSFILAKKPAVLLRSILPKETGDTRVIFDEKNLFFEVGNYQIFCRRIDGKYPKYNDVIPQNNPNKAIVDRVTLINALRSVKIYANQASELLKLTFSEEGIQLTAQDIDFAHSAEARVPCQFSGERVQIGFKASLLIDILTTIEYREVVFELSDPRRAGIIYPLENLEGEDILMLLMPIVLAD